MISEWLGPDGESLPHYSNFGILGILNLTPDSFYSRVSVNDSRMALEGMKKLIREGANIIDIGAESTRPGARPVSPEEELRRLALILENPDWNPQDTTVSIDTRNASAALYALKKGVKIINDVSAFSHDPLMLEVLANFKPAYILTHARGNPAVMQISPHYDNVLDEVMHFFARKLDALVKNGVPENRIALDPGIGFGKNLSHNLELLRNIDKFRTFGRPLLGAISMKSMFGDLLDHALHERETDSVLATFLLWQKGVFWHRVHKVSQIMDSFRLAMALQDR